MKKNYVVGGVLGTVGYILSPLSWWNDALVNIPIALLLTYIFHFFVPLDVKLLFVISYWITNVLGFMLIFLGYNVARERPIRAKDVFFWVVISVVYTVAVVKVMELLGL